MLKSTERARTPMGYLEAQIGLVPIEELLAERDKLIDEVADLRARYGSFGTWEHIRKVELAKLAAVIRAKALTGSERRRISNQQVDEEAHAHPDYIDLVTRATVERAAMIRLEARIEGIDATINRGQAIARYVSAETYLTPRTG